MKIWLDDVRPSPSGWLWLSAPEETIFYLRNYVVEEISLDHDLGDKSKGNGNDVLLWIEERVAMEQAYQPPFIYVHSCNVPAQLKMKEGIKAIQRLLEKRKENV